MAKTINANEIGIEIGYILSKYTEDVSIDIEDEIDDTANKMLDEVVNNAPGKGEYKKSFKIKKINKAGETFRIIYNKDHYQLVHLLEFGHVVKNGTGRNTGKEKTSPKPHMRPAYDKYVPQMEQNIKNIIKNGGRK